LDTAPAVSYTRVLNSLYGISRFLLSAETVISDESGLVFCVEFVVLLSGNFKNEVSLPIGKLRFARTINCETNHEGGVMNFGGILGALSAIGVVAFIVLTTGDNPKVFNDSHGIIIVIGGTLTVALMSFPFKRLLNALRIVFRKVFGKGRTDYLGTIRLIVETSTVYRVDPKKSLEGLPKNAHPFLQDAMKFLVEYGFGADEMDSILSNALKGKKKRDQEEVMVWHTVSRFPPAFGLLGATVGMIALLQTLGEPGAQDRIGPAMATALVATFYGLVVANLVLLPISEKLSELAKEDYVLRDIIREGVLLIQEKRHPLYIEEYLKSFLPPSMRQIEMTQQNEGSKESAAA
jgi:chemotaxis protein MotA